MYTNNIISIILEHSIAMVHPVTQFPIRRKTRNAFNMYAPKPQSNHC